MVCAVLLAFADLLEGRHPRALVWLTIATAWFRCDMLLLCGTVGIMLLAARKVRRHNRGCHGSSSTTPTATHDVSPHTNTHRCPSFTLLVWDLVSPLLLLVRCVKARHECACCTQSTTSSSLCPILCNAVVTVAVDSVFWRRLLWPEGVVFWYNTIMNQSPNWGTSPWHWYATSALPRSMLGAALLAPVGLLSRVNPVLGCLDRRVAHVVLPALGFVAIYSWLPHKELRFVLPVVPLLNLAAAHGAVKLCVPLPSTQRETVEFPGGATYAGTHTSRMNRCPLKIKWKLPALAVLGLLAASACLSRTLWQVAKRL